MTQTLTAPSGRLHHHLPALHAVLNQLRRFRLQQLAELDAEIDGTAVVPANAGDAARREVTIKLALAARHALSDIDETLALLATGKYGRCRGCDAEISIQLLRSIPTTRWCLNCRQQQLNRQGPQPQVQRVASRA
ncbi:TraR/DksA family transcriptional regulator [Nocardia salmonicida]|uniref:TraR/DksA family transcriptional regulator n=1 Tax=Nocardia fluminea TaxID=134984 RepID=A0A2N3VHM2_9NOCA|nr:TraR/DksA family transcriptional regulator [Nocardia fluminea]